MQSLEEEMNIIREKYYEKNEDLDRREEFIAVKEEEIDREVL